MLYRSSIVIILWNLWFMNRNLKSCWLELIASRGVRSWNPESSYVFQIEEDDSPVADNEGEVMESREQLCISD